MGLIDKFKNLFTDEEELVEEDEVDTVEIKEVKKEEENKLPTFMREKIEKEEKKVDLKLESVLEEDNSSENDSASGSSISLPKLEEKKAFKFPVDLSEDDFVETRSRQTVHQKKVEDVNEVISTRSEKKIQSEPPKVADLYKDKKVEKVLPKPKFKATPIISPIYGILDKNYTTGDIKNTSVNNLEEKRPSNNVDFDSVRKKAYGSLSREIKENLMCENCEYLKEAKECKKNTYKEVEPEYSYEVMEDEVEYKDITLDEATENYFDYGVAYERQEDRQIKDEVVISNFEEEKPKREIPPVKSSINLLSTLKKSMGEGEEVLETKQENLELTDDLFNLIDSMYDERNEK